MASVSVIVSTYNQPAWLEKVLAGYSGQDYREFELIIADDGSREETRKLIRDFAEKSDSLKGHDESCAASESALAGTATDQLAGTHAA